MNRGLELEQVLRPDLVSVAAADRSAHASDLSPSAFLRSRAGEEISVPAAVVYPETTEDVATILRWADATKTPVVPYGGGSAVVRGIEIDDPATVVVDMRRMNAIEEVDEQSLLVRVQAGIDGALLARTLAERGFTLGHEPQSLAISTVGGWLSTRATGQLSSAYGGIEKRVVGLEAVLPGGKIVARTPSPRTATGPDVAALMLGAEGTLGVITRATLRIARLPEERAHRALVFESMSDGVRACREVAQSDLHPTLVRLYDREDAAILWRHLPEPPIQPVLLLAFDGHEAAARAERAVELAGGDEGDVELALYWWEHRNDAVTEYPRLMQGEGVLGRHAVVETMEVAATWARLRDVYHSLKDGLAGSADLVGCHLSHVYPDGACLYFTIASAAPGEGSARATHERWWEVGMARCLAAGGSISHHHGIGRTKAPYLREELDGWWDVLASVKRALDPNRIMNPGALGL